MEENNNVTTPIKKEEFSILYHHEGDEKNIFSSVVGHDNQKKELLTKIIYRKERVLTKIIKTTFEKYNLRVKLFAINEVKQEKISKNKGKKKNRRKSQSVEPKCYNLDFLNNFDENTKNEILNKKKKWGIK